MRVFVDTNIWVYTHDHGDPSRQARARESLAKLSDTDVILSAQVLNEFYTVVTSRLATPVSREAAARSVDAMRRFTVLPVDGELVAEAIDLGTRVSISHWDALVVRAAVRGDCEVLLSEDLARGMVIDGVRIVSPFDDGPATPE